MSDSGRGFTAEYSAPDFDSRGSETVIIDGPGDTAARPARPLLRQLALAEREKMARWQGLLKQMPRQQEG